MRTSGLSSDLSFCSKLGNVTNPGEFFLLLLGILWDVCFLYGNMSCSFWDMEYQAHLTLSYMSLFCHQNLYFIFLPRNSLNKCLKIFWKLLKTLLCLPSFGLFRMYMQKGMCPDLKVDDVLLHSLYYLAVNSYIGHWAIVKSILKLKSLCRHLIFSCEASCYWLCRQLSNFTEVAFSVSCPPYEL